MNITNNFIIISAANRIRRSDENELLTNGIILRRSRKQAKIESTAEHLNTQNKWALLVSKREAERIAKILQGEFSTPYEVIPFTLADKIDFPNGRTKSNRELCRMIQCVLNDEPSKTNDESFNKEVEDEREQMRLLKKAKDANRQRTAKARHKKRVDGLTDEQKAAFEIIWKRHPLKNRGQERPAVYRFAEAIRKGAKIADIDKGHLRWCNSPNWKTEKERYVTQLWKWLETEQWKKEPPDRRSKREKDEEKENASASEAYLDLV